MLDNFLEIVQFLEIIFHNTVDTFLMNSSLMSWIRCKASNVRISKARATVCVNHVFFGMYIMRVAKCLILLSNDVGKIEMFTPIPWEGVENRWSHAASFITDLPFISQTWRMRCHVKLGIFSVRSDIWSSPPKLIH